MQTDAWEATEQQDHTPSRRRPPWWMLLIMASYVVLLALVPYLVIWGPADLLELTASFEDGEMVLHSVAADSRAAEAGLRGGDRVISIDGRPIRGTRDWTAVGANLEVGKVQRWEILRDGDRIEIRLSTERASWRNRLAAGYVSYSALALFSFSIGVFMALRRPHDAATRLGAWFIATTSIAFGLPNGWAALWRQIPAAFQTLFWIPELSRFVLEAIFLSLLMIFPRRLTKARWPWFLIWAPVLLFLPWRVSQFAGTIYSPNQGADVPAWVDQAESIRIMVYLAAGIVILLICYRRLLTTNEKRRIRVLVAGTAVSLGAAIALVWQSRVMGFGLSSRFVLTTALIHPLTLAAPLAFAYAIVRHRVFDIRVIIRQGLQYGLARGALLGLVPAMGVVLVLDLALNRHQPLADILQDRGWLYVGISAVAVALHWKRRRWMEAIDRRFFREQYDAQRLLQNVVQEIRTGSTIEQVSRRVASRIEEALHPDFVSLLLRDAGDGAYEPLVSLPAEKAPPPIKAESKLIALAGVLGKPLEIMLGDSGWLDRRLPPEEIGFLRRSGIDLLIPITDPHGGQQALLVLGLKRSEEPYTRKDQELLETIAASLSLLLEEPSIRVTDIKRPAKIPGTRGYGPLNQAAGDGSMVGRVFSHYRVSRRIGKGGMGEIFLAEDTSLNRKVALKFLPHLMQGDEVARKRFLREARSAAALDHPFICKIYEIGQTEDEDDFIAMEYVEGQTLKEKLAKGPLTVEQSLQIAHQITSALEVAHRRGIVHRDLKPANIMLTEQGHAKVMDFGLAKRITVEEPGEDDSVTELTRQGTAVGTPAYMSPEQIRAQPTDQRSDTFSLGIVLYEMLTGVNPFRRDGVIETMGAILQDEPRPLSEWIPQCPPSLQEIVSAMLAKDPERRCASAGELAEHLHRTLRGS